VCRLLPQFHNLSGAKFAVVHQKGHVATVIASIDSYLSSFGREIIETDGHNTDNPKLKDIPIVRIFWQEGVSDIGRDGKRFLTAIIWFP
jgi:hypothetical protein